MNVKNCILGIKAIRSIEIEICSANFQKCPVYIKLINSCYFLNVYIQIIIYNCYTSCIDYQNNQKKIIQGVIFF